MENSFSLEDLSPGNGRSSWPVNVRNAGRATCRNRSLSLVTRAVTRCRMPPAGLFTGSTLLSSRRIPWLQQCDAVTGDVLVSLNHGLDSCSDFSDDEDSQRRTNGRNLDFSDDEDNHRRTRWFEFPDIHRFLLCGRGAQSDSSDDELYDTRVRRPNSWPSSQYTQSPEDVRRRRGSSCSSTPLEACSESSEVESDMNALRRSGRHSFEVTEVLGAFVGAMTPWSSRKGQHAESDDSISPDHRQPVRAASESNVSKHCFVAKRLMEQISNDTREAASELMEQVTQDTLTVASRASDLMGQASAASDAIRRKATEEVLRLTAEHSKLGDEAFWLAPSTHANYVVLHAEMSTETAQQGLNPGSVAKLAKKASRDALKVSKQGLRMSKNASSKLWADRHEVGRMSRKLWEERPDLAKVSSKFWQDSSKLWQDAPGLATIFTGRGQKPQVVDLGGAEDLSSPALPDKAPVEAGISENVCTDALQCHMLFASPLCMERFVVVTLSLMLPPASAMEVIAPLGLAFETSGPSFVSKVCDGGQVAAWNTKCSHPEEMVRPGDELANLSVAGVSTWIRGRPIADVLKDVLARFAMPLAPGTSETPRGEVRMDLVFRGCRSVKPLRIHEEIAALHRSGCEVITRAATVHNFRNLVSRAGCRILHISLHCALSEGQPLLFLEDGAGKAHVFRSSDLQDLLRRGQEKQRIHIVFLSTCHSLSVGVHFVAAGVRHVLCIRDDDEVRDESCRLFAQEFFTALRAGRTVREAFECGCARLCCSQEQHHRKDASKFVLLPASDKHDEVYFPGGAPTSLPASLPFEGGCWGGVLPAVEDFVGREFEVHKILRELTSRRFLVLSGCSGIGKSALMSEVGRFVLLRGEPFEEVRWVDSHDEHLRKTCSDGFLDLCERLAWAPQRKVLLLVDDPEVFSWAPFSRLLRYEGVHTVVAAQQAAGSIELSPTGVHDVAQAAGLKPIRFPLGPLDLLAQARLFLSRAPRPVYTSDLREMPCNDELIASQLSPAELLAVAESPRLRALGGNPRHIITVAQALDCFDSTDAESNSSSIPSTPRGLRRVRLVRPDGKYRDEWIRGDTLIDDIAREYAPQSMVGVAQVFVMGCRAQPDTRLEEFPDVEQGYLILKLRPPVENDW